MKLISKIKLTYVLLILVVVAFIIYSIVYFESGFYANLGVSFFVLGVIVYKIHINSKIYRGYSSFLNKVREIKEADYSGMISEDKEEEFVDMVEEINNMLEVISRLKSQVKDQVKTEVKKIKLQQKEIEEKNILLEDTKIGMLNLLEDIEEDKNKIKKDRDEIKTILKSIGDAVFVIDKNKKIIIYNKASERLVGVPEAKAIGQPYDKVIKFVEEKGKKPANQFVESVLGQKGVSRVDPNIFLLRKDGEIIPVADSAAPILNESGEIVGGVIVFRDITKERAVDRAKTEFVSLASHQLRTPLTAIKWYSSAVLTEDAGKLNARQKDYVKQVYEGNQRLIELVNSLLNVSRLELGTFYVKPELVNLKSIIAGVIKPFLLLVKKKKLNFKVDIQPGLPKLKLDPTLIMIVIQNLVSNAVKYTKEKGKVDLIIKEEKSRLVINVSDNGVGIPRRQQGQIYEKLFRADNIRKMDTTGTGLGLYIVKTIVDLTGGEVSFTSKENIGTTFTVSYPMSGMKKRKGEKSLSLVKENI